MDIIARRSTVALISLALASAAVALTWASCREDGGLLVTHANASRRVLSPDRPAPGVEMSDSSTSRRAIGPGTPSSSLHAVDAVLESDPAVRVPEPAKAARALARSEHSSEAGIEDQPDLREQLEQRFDSETTDMQWTDEARRYTQSAMTDAKLALESLESVECRKTACKLEFQFDSLHEASKLYELRNPDHEMDFFVEDDRYIIFVAREGATLRESMSAAAERATR